MQNSDGEFEHWLVAAHEARYSMSRLAQRVQMNTKQLRQFFRERFRCRPKDFFDALRARHAAVALQAGFSAKEVAAAFHYRDAPHFSHALKKHLGQTPRQLVASRRRQPTFGGSRSPFEASREIGTFLQRKDTNLQGAGVGPSR